MLSIAENVNKSTMIHLLMIILWIITNFDERIFIYSKSDRFLHLLGRSRNNLKKYIMEIYEDSFDLKKHIIVIQILINNINNKNITN